MECSFLMQNNVLASINNPADTRGQSDVLLMDQRHRQWSSIKPALGQRLVYAGNILRTYYINISY